jgi:hypothetical protein
VEFRISCRRVPVERRWQMPHPGLANSLAIHHADEDVRVRMGNMAKRVGTDERVGVYHR